MNLKSRFLTTISRSSHLFVRGVFGIALSFSILACSSEIRSAKKLLKNPANDLVVPYITSITVPANGTAILGQNLDFIAQFSEAVHVTFPVRMVVFVGGVPRYANYFSGSDTTAVTFRYTVAPGENDADGITLVSPIELNSGSIQSVANTNASLSFTSPDTSLINVSSTFPTISSVTAPANGTYTASQNLDFTVTFSEAVNATAATRLVLDVGGTARYAVYQSGSGTSTVIYRYTPTGGDYDANGIAVSSPLDPNGGTIQSLFGAGSTLTFSPPNTTAVLVDATAPAITSVTAPSNATYKAAMNLDFTVNFSEAVNISASTRLAVDIGGVTRYATYSSGSGSSSAIYRYTVVSPDTDGDGISVASPLQLNGGTIRDLTANDATLTFTSPTTTAVLVDTTAPTISSVSAPANGTYVSGQNLDFTVTFSEAVNASAATRLSLDIGGVTRYATYQSGTGTSAIVYRYTVASPDLDTDGITVASPLQLNAGSVADIGGNAATLTFTPPTTTSVLVDAVLPTLTSVVAPADGSYRAGQNLDFTANFSEAVTASAGTRIAIDIGGVTRYAVYQSGNGTSALIYRYTVASPDTDANGIGMTSPLDLNGGTVRDASSNNATLTYTAPTTTALLVDTTAPTLVSVSKPSDGTYIATQNLDFTATFSEAVTVSASTRLAVDIGGVTRYATYNSGTGTTTVVYRYTVVSPDTDADGITTSSPLQLNAGTITDVAGNSATLTFAPPTMTSVLVDTAGAPYITGIDAITPGTFIAGHVLDIVVRFSKAVYITAGTRLAIDIGGVTRYATCQVRNGINATLCSYTIASPDTDTNGIAVTSPYDLNGGTVKDAGGTDAVLTFTPPTTTSYFVDTTAPTISSVTPPAAGSYKAGDNLDFTVNFSENVAATGTPRIALDIGGVTRYATYVSGSGTNAHLYRYAVASPDTDANGIGTSSPLQLNGGTLSDTGGNSATLTFTLPTTSGVLVDTTAPTIASVDVPADGTYGIGTNLNFQVNFSEAVTVAGGVRLTLDIGGTTRYATYQSGNGTTAIIFRHVVLSGDADGNGIGLTASIDLNSGTIRDAALNNATPLTFSNNSLAAVLVDGVAPTITSITPPANKIYSLGENLDFTVNFSENVTVTGSPRMMIDVGGAQNAVYLSGSGTNAHIYRYTVQSGDVDADGVQVISPLNANGGTLRDAVSNSLVMTFTDATYAGVLVDAGVATITGGVVPANGNYAGGSNLDFSVYFSKPVTVTGTPRIPLTIGGVTRYANYLSGSGSTTLVFRYTAVSPDLDSDGLDYISPIGLNGGTVRDSGSQNANLNFATGTVPGVLIDAYAPVVSITAPTGGEVFAGAASTNITWTATDTHLSATPVSLEYSTDNGVTYSAISGATSIANSGTFAWTLPSIDNTQVFVRVAVVDTYGNYASSPSAAFSIATTPPTLVAAQMNIDGGASTTSSPYGLVSLVGTDAAAKITHFCIKKNSAVAPIVSSPCWTSVSASPPGLTPSTTLTLTNYSTLISYVPGIYTLYAWVKDEVGHISTLTNAGVGTAARDKVTIDYDPKTPPVVTSVWATNTYTGTTPPVQPDQAITSGSSVYIRWNVTAANPLAATPITIDYTTDDLNYTPVPGSFANGSNGGCSVDASHTGCYTWSSGSPTSSYYRIRVTAVDTRGFTTAALSGLVNSPKLRLIAGNTYEGIDSSAASGVIVPRDDNPYGYNDHSNIVVVPDGRMFIRDKKGILMINPADGVLKLITPTTGSRSGMGGVATSATLSSPSQITYGYVHGLLIFDQDVILALNLTNYNISVLIGGGAQTGDGVTPLNVQFRDLGQDTSINEWVTRDPLVALPNGDVYFKSEQRAFDTPASGIRIRIYHYSTTGLVTSISPSGTGYSGNGGLSLNDCVFRGMGMLYDPGTSAISKMVFRIAGTAGACAGVDGFVSVNPATGAVTGSHPPMAPLDSNIAASLHTSLKGELYATDNSRFYKYDSTGNSWTVVGGDPSQIAGQCSSGTAATSCKMTVQGVFASLQDDIFFLDRNRVRTIDSTGAVRDIYGQSLAFGDGGDPLSARFNSIYSFGVSTAGKIIVHDENEYRIREINAAQTVIDSIAGDGSTIDTPSSGTAYNSFLSTNSNSGHNIVVDPATADVYYTMGRDSVRRLDRSDGTWKTVVGNGGTSWKSGDGMTGANLHTDGSYYFPQAYGNGKLLMAYKNYPDEDNVFKTYDQATSFTQAHVIGRLGAGFDTWSADGAITGTSTAHVSYDNAAGLWDSANSRWMLWDEGNKQVRTISGTTLGTWGTFSNQARSFAYKSSTNTIFYCGEGDERLYKKVGAAAATALTWDVTSITCRGSRLYYNSSTDSLYFIYKQGSMYGIAEYINP